MKSKTKTSTKGNIIIRVTVRNGEDITIIERKQEPVRFNGIDV